MGVGHRIRHRTARSVLVTVPLLWRSLPERLSRKTGRPEVCPTCGVGHPVKTYHLVLDDTGACLVSETILANLRRAKVIATGAADRGASFTYEGPVTDPPKQRIGVRPGGRAEVVQQRVHIDLDQGVRRNG